MPERRSQSRLVVHCVDELDEVLSVDLSVAVEVGCFGHKILDIKTHDVTPHSLVVEGVYFAVAIHVAGDDGLRRSEVEVVGRIVCGAEGCVVLAPVEEFPCAVVWHNALCVASEERPGDGIASGIGLCVGSRRDAIA